MWKLTKTCVSINMMKTIFFFQRFGLWGWLTDNDIMFFVCQTSSCMAIKGKGQFCWQWSVQNVWITCKFLYPMWWRSALYVKWSNMLYTVGLCEERSPISFTLIFDMRSDGSQRISSVFLFFKTKHKFSAGPWSFILVGACGLRGHTWSDPYETRTWDMYKITG